MALEKDFELLDDYLSNRMSGEDKVAFEEKIKSDPELQQELNFQKDLVESIKSARAMELKSLLNNIPISTIPSGQSVALKVGTWVGIAGIVATSIYFFTNNDTVAEQPLEEVILEEPKELEPETPLTEEPVNTQEEIAEEEIKEKSIEPTANSKKEPVKSSPVTKPKLEVYDPNKEASSTFNATEQVEIISKAFVTSSIEVVTNNENEAYKFHYAFMNHKLVLYGISEKDLYEILEFFGEEKRTVFLYYKTNYYWLDSAQNNPTPLLPIKDKKLLTKLKEYRKN